MRPFRVRDPIHDFIELRDVEVAAMDVAPFQRLREISQLAMTHLVYPGTRHSRFEHSLGVCQIAGRLAIELELEEEDVSVVRTAGLLHDLGHGPFSHVSENVLEDRSGVRGVHEAISVALIRSHPALDGVVSDDLRQAAGDLIGGVGGRTVQRDIVSGPTDADKLDYLLRDSHYAGVAYGHYDLDRLIDTAAVIKPDEIESYLGFDADGVWAVEGLLLARHHMHRQVYGHKTRIATDVMIERALSHGIEEGAIDSFAYDVPVDDRKPAPSEAFLESYLRQTDASVMSSLLSQEEATASRDLAERLRRRELIRQSATVALHRNRERLGGPRLGRILDQERFRTRTAEIEAEIAEELGCPAYLVALRVDESDNPTYRLPGSEINPKDIMLRYRDHEPDYFQRESEIFREEAGEAFSFAYLYAPRIQGLTDARSEELLWKALESI
jgi:HD superfamily phosphohydrolase